LRISCFDTSTNLPDRSACKVAAFALIIAVRGRRIMLARKKRECLEPGTRPDLPPVNHKDVTGWSNPIPALRG
jgi:hypothetical protein